MAFEIVDDAAPVIAIGAASVISIADETYAITEIPLAAQDIESSLALPADFEGTKVTTGCPITRDEAIKVMETYFHKLAIDFSRVQVRNINLSDRQFITWCTSKIFFSCTEQQIRAGTWFDFEVNGPNISGGMTGFTKKIWLIRRSPPPGGC